MITNNFAKHCIDNGGKLIPLNIDSSLMVGTSFLNPSVFIDGTGKILINIRHTDYTVFHSVTGKYRLYGKGLRYDYAQDINHTVTTNYICELDNQYNISAAYKINTSSLDKDPQYVYVGLEDARLVNWNNTFYLSGTRRDTTSNGEGRIELSEIKFGDNQVVEINRVRMPAPGENNSYCEKNWMPILDRPFHFVKWTNPTEVVRFDIDTQITTTVQLNDYNWAVNLSNLKGGSHLVPWNGYYVAVVHESYYDEAESAQYLHRFAIWDQNLNLKMVSDTFIFMDGSIEFCCGMAYHNHNFFLSFGFQDNISFLLKFPESIIYQIFS